MRGVTIGIAGSLAAGKSTILKSLCDKLNAKPDWAALHLDADAIAHESYAPDTPLYDKLVDKFGDDIVKDSDRTIDREALGKIVAQDNEALTHLERMTWPAIHDNMMRKVNAWDTSKANRVILIDAAALLRAGWHSECDDVWVFWCDRSTAVERAVKRGSKAEQAGAFWDKQMKQGGLTGHQTLTGVEALEAKLQGHKHMIVCTDSKPVEATVYMLEIRLGSVQL